MEGASSPVRLRIRLDDDGEDEDEEDRDDCEASTVGPSTISSGPPSTEIGFLPYFVRPRDKFGSSVYGIPNNGGRVEWIRMDEEGTRRWETRECEGERERV